MIQNTSIPAVSVIIPVYKVEEYLRECLDSVVNQTLKNIEIICVDDGSPDGSASIVKEYVEQYNNIVLIQKENEGQSVARNVAMNIMRGRYVYYLDSDDYIAPDMFETLCAQADEEDLDIIYFNAMPIFENDQVKADNQNYIDYYTRNHDYSGIQTGQFMFTQMRSNREFIPTVWSQFYRRSFLEEHGLRFYDGIIHEDNLFVFQCAMLAKRTKYINKAFYYRRVHGNSTMTTGKSMKNVEGYLVCYLEMLSFLKKCEIDESAWPVISEYLYYGIYRNACNIYRSLHIKEEDAVLTHGGVGAAHLLDLVKKNSRIEFEKERLGRQNEDLRKKILNMENNARAVSASRRKRFLMYIPRKTVGFFLCVKDHGMRYTLHRFFEKLWNKMKICDKRWSNNRAYRIISWPAHKLHSILNTVRKYGVAHYFRVWHTKYLVKHGSRNPFVSIIMPVYNAAEFLEQGMDTLMKQTMRNIEVIAVDDGSSDNSLEILKHYEVQDSRVRVFTQQNKHAGAARNLGLTYARGEYVIFLDSDDFFARSLCEDAFLAAKVHNADVVIFGAKHYNNTLQQYKEAPWLLQAHLAPNKQPFNYEDCPDLLYRITTPVPWTKMFRREFIAETGLQFQTLHNSNDVFFIYSALAMAKRIAVVNKSLVYYRVGLASNLQSKKKRQPFCFYEAYLAWYNKLKELGVLDTVRKSYVNVALSGCLHNLRSNNDAEVKKQVFEKLKHEVFETLEICGYDASYYYVKKNYKDMMMILNGSFEEYMEVQE